MTPSIIGHSGPVELPMSTSGQAVIPPDQGFFDGLNGELQDKGFLVVGAEELFQWARTGSLWWMTFGLACCAVEMIHVNMPAKAGISCGLRVALSLETPAFAGVTLEVRVVS